MSRYAHLLFGVLLMMAVLGRSVAAQGPTLSLNIVAVNGQRLEGDSLTRICANPGDLIDIEVYIRDWSANKQPLAGYQVEIDPVSFASGALGVIEPVGLQDSIEADKPDLKSSYVDRKHPRFIYKGLQSLDVTKSFGKGYRVAGVVVGDQGPISDQDGVPYYAGTMSFIVSDNAAGRFVLVPASQANKSVLVDRATVSILPLHCESIVIDICSDVDASSVARFIDNLLSTDQKSDLQLPCEAVVVNNQARVSLGLDALNARRFSLDHPNIPDEDLITTNEGT